ncbi:unnamed protein product [Sphagnum compactum]
MEELPGSVLEMVLSKISAGDCARSACVARLWRHSAYQEVLWESYCRRDFPLAFLDDPLGKPCSSWKDTYHAWNKTSALVSRATCCWEMLRGWMQENFCEVAESLAPGASQQELAETERILHCNFPPAVHLLYRLCNGQEIPESDADEDELTSDLQNNVGLFGGYSFSHHFVNVHLLSLHQVVKLTQRIVPHLQLPPGSHRVIVAASSHLNKFFFLDCDDGNIYVGTRNLLIDGEMMLCVPTEGSEVGREPQDGMLRWLEGYAQALHMGMFHVRTEGGSGSISLYPETSPLCTAAVTRGVQVRCSAVFVPELSRLEELEDRFWFSYSVRMRLLPSHEQGANSLTSCQLSARHWVIRAHDTVNEVRGEAVIGLFPLLREGDEEFVYESCTGLSAKSGSLDGDFTFTPGRLTQPEGPAFTALVARFPLEVPQYIY